MFFQLVFLFVCVAGSLARPSHHKVLVPGVVTSVDNGKGISTTVVDAVAPPQTIFLPPLFTNQVFLTKQSGEETEDDGQYKPEPEELSDEGIEVTEVSVDESEESSSQEDSYKPQPEVVASVPTSVSSQSSTVVHPSHVLTIPGVIVITSGQPSPVLTLPKFESVW